MEQVVAKVFEYSLVGGAFVYLLHFVTKGMTKTVSDGLTLISENMKAFGVSLNGVTDALLKIDMRVAQLEQEVRDIQKEVKS